MTPHTPLKGLSDEYSRGLLERDAYRRKRAELLAELTAAPREDRPPPPASVAGKGSASYWLAVLTVVAIAGALLAGWYLGLM